MSLQLGDSWTYMDVSIINTLPFMLLASKEVLQETVAPEKKEAQASVDLLPWHGVWGQSQNQEQEIKVLIG